MVNAPTEKPEKRSLFQQNSIVVCAEVLIDEIYLWADTEFND